MQIGKHEWRAVVYQGDIYPTPSSDFEWRKQPEDQWRSMNEWPTVNHNDGMYAGCPKSLVRLYNNNRSAIKAALTGKTTPQGVLLPDDSAAPAA